MDPLQDLLTKHITKLTDIYAGNADQIGGLAARFIQSVHDPAMTLTDILTEPESPDEAPADDA